VADGAVTTHVGSATAPGFVLEGDAPAVLGVLSGVLSLAEARRQGLRAEGSTALLRRVRYKVPSGTS
jgi:hypothetical protein